MKVAQFLVRENLPNHITQEFSVDFLSFLQYFAPSWFFLQYLNSKMEIQQLKLVEDILKDQGSVSGSYEQFQIPQYYDTMDWVIQQLLSENNVPFQIKKDNQQKRETQNIEPQTQNIKDKILNYCRKEKSLAELSRRFLNRFEGTGRTEIALDKVTTELNVQRRRIYDIINIMESLGVVSKKKKNLYLWKGLSEAIITIQTYANGQQLKNIHEKVKKQKSLESLATQFLKLFINQTGVISLEEAADLILKQGSDSEARKTKIRRLYDIVNVFKCLNLVEKISSPGEKSGFKWRGCMDLVQFIEDKKQGKSSDENQSLSLSSKKSSSCSVNEKQQFDEDLRFDTQMKFGKNDDILETRIKHQNQIMAPQNANTINYPPQASNSYLTMMVSSFKDPKLTYQDLNNKLTELIWPKIGY